MSDHGRREASAPGQRYYVAFFFDGTAFDAIVSLSVPPSTIRGLVELKARVVDEFDGSPGGIHPEAVVVLNVFRVYDEPEMPGSRYR